METPLRVLHVVVNMNRGGAETLIMNLFRNIDRTKIQFDFLTCKRGLFDDEIKELGGKVHRIPYITDVGPFKYNKALETFFKNHSEYRIVHSHMDKMSGFVLRAAKKAGVPVRIAHSHNTSSEGNILTRSIKWYAGNLVLRNATQYLACSRAASRWLFKQQANKAYILKNGIDNKIFKYTSGMKEKIRETYNLNKNQFVVGHVGRFCHQKNHDFLIDIFFRILEINSDAILVLVGDGPLKEKVKMKVFDFGLSNNVLFLGVQNNVHEIIQAFDVMVFPSFHEGLPVTLIEAQSVGLPCLISNRVTDEVDIGAGLIQYESLNMSSTVWASKALIHNERIKDVALFIKNSGYDIKQSATWLEEFYMTRAMGDLFRLRKVKTG